MKRLVLRFLYPTAFSLLRIWWHLAGTRHEGALAAVYVREKLLLLQSSYRADWNMPGGGLKTGETPEQAVRRELREEIGLEVGPLDQAGFCSGIWEGRHDTCHFFELRLDEMPRLKLDNVEILGARLFSKDELAELNVTAAVRCYLDHAALPRAADTRTPEQERT